MQTMKIGRIFSKRLENIQENRMAGAHVLPEGEARAGASPDSNLCGQRQSVPLNIVSH